MSFHYATYTINGIGLSIHFETWLNRYYSELETGQNNTFDRRFALSIVFIKWNLTIYYTYIIKP